MPDIMHWLRIEAPAERVYQALTTTEGVRNWWTRDAALGAAVGQEGEFGFYDRGTVTTVRIDELSPPHHVSWTVLSSPAPGGWGGTTIAFDLATEGEFTALSFAHRGLPRADKGYAQVTTGWAYYLVSLRQYVETGQGAPHPDVDFARVIR